MRLGLNFGYITKQLQATDEAGYREAAELCKASGFSVLDYSPDIRVDNWEEKAHLFRKIFDEVGLEVIQSHAPMNRYGAYPAEIFPELTRRCIHAASILGAKHIAFHADEYITTDRYDPKEILDFTYDYLAPSVELAKKLSVGIAVENVFDDGRGTLIDGKCRFTSRVEELLSVIERFNDPAVTCCWDFGHGKVAYEENALAAFRQVLPYLTCTHVHDNYYQTDLHLLPFLGASDWKPYMQALKDSNYAGDFTYEFVYGKIPAPLLPDFLSLAKKAADYLFTLAE